MEFKKTMEVEENTTLPKFEDLGMTRDAFMEKFKSAFRAEAVKTLHNQKIWDIGVKTRKKYKLRRYKNKGK